MRMRRNPAAFAGLAGLAASAMPLPAYALSLDEVSSSIFSTPGTAFVVGALGGAVVTGVVSGVVCHALIASDARRHESRRDEEAFIEGVADARMRPASRETSAARPAGKHFRVPEPADAADGPAKPSSDDYEQVAESYVGKKTPRRQGFAAQAQSVAQTLRERIDAGMMEGLPVIARADGSVADVGTSWWNTSVGIGSVTKVEDYVDDQPSEGLAIPSAFEAKTGKERLVEAAKSSSGFLQADISQRLAFVDEGEFPERRDADDAFADDVWASALRSMDERLNAQDTDPASVIAMPFYDVVGDMDTLDEPDGLEQSTKFLPFKTPAGHPEVVDTETYVDYLIGDEFGRNSSKATRKAAGRFLRLIEGGTSTTRLGSAPAHRTGSVSSKPAPKHFAPAPMAKEA